MKEVAETSFFLLAGIVGCFFFISDSFLALLAALSILLINFHELHGERTCELAQSRQPVISIVLIYNLYLRPIWSLRSRSFAGGVRSICNRMSFHILLVLNGLLLELLTFCTFMEVLVISVVAAESSVVLIHSIETLAWITLEYCCLLF